MSKTPLGYAYELAQTGLDDFQAQFIRKWWNGLLLAVALLALGAALTACWIALTFSGVSTGPVPQPARYTISPATGEQGWNTEAFCLDPLTKVTRLLFVPPDSSITASYTLDRTRDGIHEVIDANYTESTGQWKGIHNPDTTHESAFVSSAAAKCIIQKGGTP